MLAAFRAQLWVALTTATVTALTAWVSDLKLDVNLVKYNQAAAELFVDQWRKRPRDEPLKFMIAASDNSGARIESEAAAERTP